MDRKYIFHKMSALRVLLACFCICSIKFWNCNTPGATSGAGTAPLVEQELLTSLQHPSSSPVCSGYRVTLTLDLCVMFLKSLFVLLSFFVWPLVYDLRLFITPLVSSNSWYLWEFILSLFCFSFYWSLYSLNY